MADGTISDVWELVRVRNAHGYVRSVRKNIPSVSSEFRHHANIH